MCTVLWVMAGAVSWATITKHHQLWGSEHQKSTLSVSEAPNPKSRCGQGPPGRVLPAFPSFWGSPRPRLVATSFQPLPCLCLPRTSLKLDQGPPCSRRMSLP